MKASAATSTGVQTVTIKKDKQYTEATIDNYGQIQFDVEYPTDKNSCVIKLQVEFKKNAVEDGGTVKIER